MVDVSIILPVYNGETYIQGAVNSVLAQSCENFEIIIIDDCSTDNTVSFIEKIPDSRIKLTRLDVNKGVANARNIGLEKATSDIICFIDADDIWHKKKLEIQLEKHLKKGLDVSYTKTYEFDETVEAEGGRECLAPKIKSKRHTPRRVTRLSLLFFGNNIPLSSSMVSKCVIESVRFSNVHHEDFDFWLQIMGNDTKAELIDDAITYYRVGHNSLNSNKIKSIHKHVMLLKKHSANTFQFMFFATIYIITKIYFKVMPS